MIVLAGVAAAVLWVCVRHPRWPARQPAELLLCLTCGQAMEEVPGPTPLWRCGSCGATSGATQ